MATSVLDIAPVFDLQLTLLDEESIGLHCTNCGFTFDVDRDWLSPRAGEHVGCPNCARRHQLPSIKR